MSGAEHTATDGKTEFGFPLRTGKTWYLSEKKHAEYADAYTDLDLKKEFNKARQWLRDRTDRRKTARGMTRFLTGWLNSALDKCGGSKMKSGKRAAIAPPREPWRDYRDRTIMANRKDASLRELSDEDWKERFEQRKETT